MSESKRASSIEKTRTVIDILAGQVSVEQAAVEWGAAPQDVEEWKTLYLAGARSTAEMQQSAVGSRFRRRPILTASMAITGILAVFWSREVISQAAECVTTGDVCVFTANTPARASEINHNFQRIEDGKVDMAEDDPVSLSGGLSVINGLAVDEIVDAVTVENSVTITNAPNAGSGTGGGVVIPGEGGQTMRIDSDGILTETALYLNEGTTNAVVVGDDIQVGGDATVAGNLNVDGVLTAGQLNTHPTGSYCIISGVGSSGGCPAGFSDGYVRIDTEDSDNGDGFSGSTGGVTNGSNSSINLFLCCK